MDIAQLGIRVDSTQLRTASRDMEGFVRTGKRTEQVAQGVTTSTAAMGSAMSRAARMIAVATGALAGIGAALKGAQQYTEITNSFKAMGQSGEQAAASLEAVARVAKGTRAPLEATAQLYQRISIAGKDLGASQSQVLRFTENVGLALAQTGTSASQASGALLQLSQAMAGGVVRAEEFNSILEGAYPIAQAAAEGIEGAAGSVGKLRQMVVDGKVSSDEFFNAILSQTDALQAAFQNTTPTISQAFTVLSDSMTLFVGGMDAAVGVSASIAKAILVVADNVDRLAAYAGTAAVALGTYYAGAAAIAAAKTITLAGAMTTLRTAMARTGILLLVVGAGELVHQFGRLVSATGGWGNALSLLGDVAAGVWEGIKGSAQSIVPALGAVWQSVKAAFIGALADMGASWAMFLGSIALSSRQVPFLGDAVGDKIAAAAMNVERSIDGLYESASRAGDAASGLRDEASNLATAGFDKAREAAQKLADAVAGNADETDAASNAANSLNTALGKVTKGAGKSGKALDKAKDEAEAFNKALKDAVDTAEELGTKKANILIGGIDSLSDAWGDFVTRGFQNFEDFTQSILDSFTGMLSDMIALAARNQIMLSFNMSGTGAGGAAGAVSSAAGGGSGLGILGGIFGSGGFFGGIGSGFGIGLGNLFGAGGGIGTYFGGLGAQAGAIFANGFSGSALGGLIGMAAPLAVGIALLSKGLSQKYAGTALRGSLNSEGFEGGQFDFYKGGFLRGNKEVWSDAPSALSEYIDQAMTGVVGSIETYADALALSTKDALKVAGEEFTIWLSDLSEDEILEALNSEVQAVADEMAALVLGTEAYTRSGETASETLARLGQGILAVNDAADLLGHRIWAVSLASADAASELVEAFGGLEAMTSAVNTYFTTMYSEEEQLEINTRRLRDTFADLGVVFPQTREEYRQLVEGIDTTSEAGRQLYADLISLSGAMDAVLGPLFGFTPEIAGMIDAATALIDTQIQERQELARTLEQSSRLWLRTAETLRDFLTDLRTTSLGGLNPFQVLEATSMRYADTFTAARGGDIDAAGNYVGDAKAYLNAVGATAATAVDYRRAAMQVERDAQLLAGISEFEGAKDQYISDLYEAQIDVLEEMKTLLQSGDLTAEALADLNGTLGELQSAIEAAEVLSYDYLRHNLDLVLDLIPTADVPPELAGIIEAAGGSLETLIDLIFRDENLDPGMRFLLAGEAINGISILDIALTEPNTALAEMLATGVLDGAATLTAEIGAGTPEGLAALLSEGVYTAKAFAKILFADTGSKALKKAIRSGEVDLDALIKGKILGDSAAAKLLKRIGKATTSWINVGGEFEFDPSSDLTRWFDNSLANGVAAPIASLGNMIGGLVGALTSYEAAVEKRAADLAAEQERIAKIAAVQGKLDKFEANWGANSEARVAGLKDELDALVASTGVSLAGIKINSDGQLVYDSSGVSGTVAQLDAFRASGFWDDGGLQDKIASANASAAKASDYESTLLARLTNLQSFDGGGYTGSGARSGGVDGKGGFPAILHPNETVTDHTRGGGNGSIVAELAALRAEVAKLRAERRADARETVKSTKGTYRLLRDWDINGQPLERT